MTIQNWLLTHGEDAQTGMYFGVLALCMLVERLWASRAPGEKSGPRLWANYAMTALGVVLLMALPLSFISAASWAEDRGWGLLNLLAMPAGVALCLTFLARSLLSWTTHYLAHRVPVLWRLHRVHHMDTELDVSTTVRVHPVEFVVNLALGLPVIVVFGLPPWALIAYELCDVVVAVFSHSNVKIPKHIERWLRWFIVTPDMHRIHHSAYRPETDSNFSAVFPLWDYLLGTFRGEATASGGSFRLGLEVPRDRRTAELGWLLLSPLFDISPRPEAFDTAPAQDLSNIPHETIH
jgi:sterol desaturase/sphingolipid hydroxylase (fatty acid hydroxylase superfamily)